MNINDTNNYWIWASKFFLDNPLTKEHLTSEDGSYEELDSFIQENIAAEYKHMNVDEVWELLDMVATSAMKTFDFKGYYNGK